MRIRFDRSSILQTGGAVALFAFALTAPMMAQAQNSDVNGRLTRIENEIQTLSRAMFKGEVPPASAIGSAANPAGVENRLSQIERDLQALTGRVEEISYDINRLKNLSDMNSRAAASAPVQQPSASVSSSTTQTMPGYPGVGMSSTTVSPSGTWQAPAEADAPAPADSPTTGRLGSLSASATPDAPTAAYEAAFTALRNQDYAQAQSGFNDFIKKNPSHALVPNAMYWLGETYYVRNEFDQAARIFAESYQKYPKGAKAADNLLKLAMSLAGQGKTKDACVALGQLKKEYPAGAAPVLTRADQESSRLNCAAL